MLISKLVYYNTHWQTSRSPSSSSYSPQYRSETIGKESCILREWEPNFAVYLLAMRRCISRTGMQKFQAIAQFGLSRPPAVCHMPYIPYAICIAATKNRIPFFCRLPIANVEDCQRFLWMESGIRWSSIAGLYGGAITFRNKCTMGQGQGKGKQVGKWMKSEQYGKHFLECVILYNKCSAGREKYK